MEVNYFFNKFDKYLKKYIKSPPIMKLTILFILLIIIPYLVYTCYNPTMEGFKDDKNLYDKLKIVTGPKIYDTFYANIYDDLLYCKDKNDFEVNEILRVTKLSPEEHVLDIGSGTGHHVNLFKNKNLNAIGLDLSPAMIKKAKKNYPNETYQLGNAINGSHFMPNKFSLITCFYFTIYYFNDKRQLFQNCIHWLQPGGYMVIHLVDKFKFDPVLPPADPFIIVSPQKYADERITTSTIIFDTHDYTSNFKLESNNMATMYETFKNKKNGNIRKNEHRLYFDNQKSILSLAQSVGFEFVEKIDMAKCQYDNQFIYILKKPS